MATNRICNCNSVTATLCIFPQSVCVSADLYLTSLSVDDNGNVKFQPLYKSCHVNRIPSHLLLSYRNISVVSDDMMAAMPSAVQCSAEGVALQHRQHQAPGTKSTSTKRSTRTHTPPTSTQHHHTHVYRHSLDTHTHTHSASEGFM